MHKSEYFLSLDYILSVFMCVHHYCFTIQKHQQRLIHFLIMYTCSILLCVSLTLPAPSVHRLWPPPA